MKRVPLILFLVTALILPVEAQRQTISPRLILKSQPFVSKDGWSIQLPVSWEVRENLPGVDMVAISPLERKRDQFPETCAVAVAEIDQQTLEDFFQDRLKELKIVARGFKAIKTGHETIDELPAKWLIYEHQVGGLPLINLEYTLVDKGRGAVINLSTTKREFALWRANFEAIAKSFRFLPVQEEEVVMVEEDETLTDTDQTDAEQDSEPRQQ